MLASIAAATVVLACGGGGAKTPATGAGRADAGAEGGPGAGLTTSPPPSGLPPMASMPPPGVAGSKKAKRRPDAALAACSGATRTPAKDPADLVKRLGDGCMQASKMKPASAMLRGQQADKDTHQENKLRVEANRCYRLYVAADDSVKDMVVVLRDSAGDIVAESPGPAVPEDGAVCFNAADEISILVGVGSGKGTWAAQVWSD
ncbi:MAG: hypothetical protein BGO98_41380 [Myxococcales bacterium 68-20]|nr:hypothetical protein [Myxococcales bacterium]OJY27716.1 MAG: hypothetical protein BGO98_41380 [Myxococcales bacterium 68-20]